MTVYQYIKAETDPEKLHEGVRDMLRRMDERGTYPQDGAIKRIQRLVDARYEELKNAEEDPFEEEYVDPWEREYIRSVAGGDYGSANPWDAPGMSVSDFI